MLPFDNLPNYLSLFVAIMHLKIVMYVIFDYFPMMFVRVVVPYFNKLQSQINQIEISVSYLAAKAAQ